MAHLDPDDRRRATDYIDRGDASVGWAPLALVIAFLVLVGFLIVGQSHSKLDRQHELFLRAAS